MIDQEHREQEEIRVSRAARPEAAKPKTNNELLNAVLNGCKHPRRVMDALAAFLCEISELI